MKVYKFGGTSVGLPERMHKVRDIITADGESKVVVLSAVSGTTNDLVRLSEYGAAGNRSDADILLETLEKKYHVFITDLYKNKETKSEMKDFVRAKFEYLRKLSRSGANKEILAQGELMSTRLFHEMLLESGIRSQLVPALDYMSIDEDREPIVEQITQKLLPVLKNSDAELFITQGFICLNHEGEIDNLERGGSDYSASLVGAGISAEEVQIWTDIDGLHNNDPRIVKGTYPVAELSFDEAAELAYFGAKILHPSSILPAQKFNIPVRLKSTMNEEAAGTLISKRSVEGAVKAIAVKDGITAIKIKSTRMLLAYGFLTRVFEVFEKHKTAIDMITTSEVAVSLTIDNSKHLAAIVAELEEFGWVDVDENQSIVCVVGNMVSEQKGVVRKIFNALSDIPIRMVSYGGSRFNISLLIDSSYRFEALNNLNTGLFEDL